MKAFRSVYNAALLAVGVVSGAVLLFFNAQDCRVGGGASHAPIEQVYAVDEDTLLVAGNTGQDSDIRRTSHLALLELDGRLHSAVTAKEAVEVLGVADDIVWLESDSHGIHARSLPELTMIDGINAAIQQHGPLSHRAEPQGFTATHIRLLGGDFEKYAVSRSGQIEREAEDAEWTRIGGRASEGEREVPFKEVRALQATAKEKGLNTPVFVDKGLEPGIFKFDDPPSVLVTSFDLVVGGHSQSLHRMQTDGTLLWSATAEALTDALELNGQWIHIDWVGVRGETIFVLAEISEFDRDSEGNDWESHVPRLIEVDPKTGVVLASHAVKSDEA
jgi:hypothetical protein